MKTWRDWRSDECGATAIEYALIAGGVALLIVVGAFFAGNSLGNLFNTMSTTTSSVAARPVTL